MSSSEDFKRYEDDRVVHSEFQHWVSALPWLAAMLPDEQGELRRRLQANVKVLSQNFRQPDEQQLALENFQPIETEEEQLIAALVRHKPPDDIVVGYAADVADQALQSLLGEDYVQSSDEEGLRTVRYMRDARVVAAQIVDANNFYFKPPAEVAVEGDVLPEEGQVIETEDYIACRATLFDTFGMQVYWGDVATSDLEELYSTYYLLPELSGDKTVLDYAVTVGMPASAFYPNDPLVRFSEAAMLEMDYLRANAFGAIVGRKYLPQPGRPQP